MKLKLDENLGERGRKMLATAGHDVSTVTLQRLESALDEAVIEACRREGRALVTLDLDFANPLDYRPSEYAGIAVLRLPKKATPEDLLQTIETFAKGLEQNPLAGRLWIVEQGRIRLYQQDDGAMMMLPLVKALTPRLQADCVGQESGNAPILEKVTPVTADLLRWWFQSDCCAGHERVEFSGRA